MKRIQSLTVCLLFALAGASANAQSPEGALPKAPDPIEKLGDNLFRLGAIRVDTAKREVTVTGKVNDTNVLEFIANTKNGFRAYESAFELETNGLTFNVAMILIGLDKANSVPPEVHFDPNPPKGDPVEVWVEWKAGKNTKRMRADEILWDKEKKEAFPKSQWVYTGSALLDDGRYLADQDAVLIGFVHDPSSIIEWTGSNGVGRFGFIQIDPKLGLAPGTPVTIIVKATGAASKKF
jgi:hypothetical protein